MNNINDKINLEEKLMYFKKLKVFYKNGTGSYNKIKFSYDKEFFNFLRSTSFAHPFQTNGAYGNKLEEEVFYCPYITLDDEKCINLTIYSNIRGIISISFKFKKLKDYVLFNYNKLVLTVSLLNTFMELLLLILSNIIFYIINCYKNIYYVINYSLILIILISNLISSLLFLFDIYKIKRKIIF